MGQKVKKFSLEMTMTPTSSRSPGHPAQALGRRVPGEAAAKDEHPVREVLVGRPLPRLVPAAAPRRTRRRSTSAPDRPATDGERALANRFNAPSLVCGSRLRTPYTRPPEAIRRRPEQLGRRDASMARVIHEELNGALSAAEGPPGNLKRRSGRRPRSSPGTSRRTCPRAASPAARSHSPP